MISLLKSYNYTAVVKGEKHTVRCFNKETALEYFQIIDKAIVEKDITMSYREKGDTAPTIEERSESLPTNTNLYQ